MRKKISERLVEMLAAKGYDVDIGPTSVVGYWRIRRAETDVCSWEAWAKGPADGTGFRRRVNLVCDSTMTECVRHGIEISHSEPTYAFVFALTGR